MSEPSGEPDPTLPPTLIMGRSDPDLYPKKKPTPGYRTGPAIVGTVAAIIAILAVLMTIMLSTDKRVINDNTPLTSTTSAPTSPASTPETTTVTTTTTTTTTTESSAPPTPTPATPSTPGPTGSTTYPVLQPPLLPRLRHFLQNAGILPIPPTPAQ